MPRNKEPYIIFPPTIVIDKNEGTPWEFRELTDPKDGRQIICQTVRRALWAMDRDEWSDTGLGDYSLEHEGHVFHRNIQIERKSPNDLFETILGRRDAFERELQRFNEDDQCDYAAVVVEASILNIANYDCPSTGKQTPQAKRNTVLGTVKSWKQLYPKVHWFFEDGRGPAELRAFRILEMWWGHFQRGRLPRLREKLRKA